MNEVLYRGTFVHMLDANTSEIINDGAMLVSNSGTITKLFNSYSPELAAKYSVCDLRGNLIVPGFIDAHIHLPQYVFAGIGATDLLPWLNTYTFPVEAKFADNAFATKVSQVFFADLLKRGTTFAAVYSSMHTSATNIAFLEAEKAGIRAIIGKVLMERNAPCNVSETGEQGLLGTEQLAESWHGKHDKLFVAVTPRFAITCTENTMRNAAILAKKHNLYIQTHVAENHGEINLVAQLFPNFKTYLDVYDKCGLLTEKTLLAHCLYLNNDDKLRMQNTGAVAVHCPTSNRFLASGVFDFEGFTANNIKVALGTDVAGGYSPFMVHEMREMLETSKTAKVIGSIKGEVNKKVASIENALYTATLGGAHALGMQNKLGNFASGKYADFVVINDSLVNNFSWTGLYQSPLEKLSRVIYRGDERSIAATYIQGKCVYQNA